MKKFTIVGTVMDCPVVESIEQYQLTKKTVRVYTNEPYKTDIGYIEVPFMGKACDYIDEESIIGKVVEIEGYLIGSTWKHKDGKEEYCTLIRGTTLKVLYQPKYTRAKQQEPEIESSEYYDDDMPF